MAKSLHEDSKKLLSMMKGKKSQAAPPVKSTVKKAAPKKAIQNPIKNKAAQAAQPKKALNTAKKAKAMDTKPVVAEKAVKPKAAKVPKMEIPMDGPPPPNEAMKFGSELERDLPKGGGRRVMHIAEDLGEAELPQVAKSSLGAVGKKAGKVALLGGMAGLGLQALMEAVDAEDSNPAEHDLAAGNAAKTVAHEQYMQHGAVPKESLQKELPSQTKTPGVRSLRSDEYGVEGASPQQKMEDDFAREMRKWPR